MAKEYPVIKSIQTVFLYDPWKQTHTTEKVLKDESQKHFNMPPSPRFGEMSLSFGNEDKSSNKQYLETEQAPQFNDSFSNFAIESKPRNHNSSMGM